MVPFGLGLCMPSTSTLIFNIYTNNTVLCVSGVPAKALGIVSNKSPRLYTSPSPQTQSCMCIQHHRPTKEAVTLRKTGVNCCWKKTRTGYSPLGAELYTAGGKQTGWASGCGWKTHAYWLTEKRSRYQPRPRPKCNWSSAQDDQGWILVPYESIYFILPYNFLLTHFFHSDFHEPRSSRARTVTALCDTHMQYTKLCS